MYLSIIRDLYDNSIVAYKTATWQTVNLVPDTIRLAMKQEKIITTGRAGGLHKPPWGMSRAEPIGSSNRLPIARISRACP